ncbi:hypothetical protein SAMN05443247_04703 [Bradyrhizobium erythrophlei]|nr:hypothetical protein SAMN05443247_04703 [Bradyrhizobium erythrophlei]
MVCIPPAVPPQLVQATQICSEAVPTTDAARAALAGCTKVWSEYRRLRKPYDDCVASENLSDTKAIIDGAVNSIDKDSGQ